MVGTCLRLGLLLLAKDLLHLRAGGRRAMAAQAMAAQAMERRCWPGTGPSCTREEGVEEGEEERVV